MSGPDDLIEELSALAPYDWGGRLRIARKAAGLTLREAAERTATGVHFTTIGKLESGKMQVTIDWAKRLSAVYQVPLADIIFLEGSASSARQIQLYDACAISARDERNEWPILGSFATTYGSEEAFALVTGHDDDFGNPVERFVVIDPEQKRLRFGSAYAVALDGEVTILRCTPEALQAMPPWPGETIEIGLRPFTTLGRVVMEATGYSY